jgi:hypothetical protein
VSGRGGQAADGVRARRTGVGVAARRRWVTARGIRVGVRLVSGMPEDAREVAEAEAGGLAPAGVSEAGVQQPGWRPRRGGRAGRGRDAAVGRAVRVGGGRGVGVLVRRAGDERRTACTRVGSGGDGCADCDDVDLNRVRWVGACDIFLNKVITYIDHPVFFL